MKMIDDFIAILHKGFSEIKERRRTNNGNVVHSLQDCLMAGFAMFSLKDPSLHQFRKNYKEREETKHNNNHNNEEDTEDE